VIVVGRCGAPTRGGSIAFSRAGDPAWPRQRKHAKSSRFIILFAFVSAFGYGIMVVLANWPQPVQRQIVVRIPEERFSKAGRRALGPLETQKSDRLAGVLEELKLQH
jgi:hypothetical protein